MDLSKVEAGKLELELSDVNLNMLLENGQTMIKEKAMKHGITLSVELEGIPEYIKADDRKLKQIVYNLLSNAVKFTPDGGRVLLAAKYITNTDRQLRNLSNSAKKYVQISVEDTGSGLRKKDIARIFLPFEQAHSSAGSFCEGTGLGLSLTKRLVELHGGKIWAESEGEGKGSTFSFCIRV